MSQTEEVPSLVTSNAEPVSVQPGTLDKLAPALPSGDPIGLESLLSVPVQVTVEVGRAKLSLAELVKLQAGSIVSLEREAHESVDVLVNGKIVARGEVVTVGGNYGVRITSVSAG